MFGRYAVIVLALAACYGCAGSQWDVPQENWVKPVFPATQPVAEETMLSDVIQLTGGFSRAGEAYFSPEMRSIVFQAVPHGQAHYQMYVAALEWGDDRITGIKSMWRVSPANSRNTCGYFSPDGKKIIFGSTAGKEEPDDPAGGYQRQGRSYVWAFPKGMEIFRESLISIKSDRERVRLTNNDVYDAECAYSPDGKLICYTHGAGKDADIYVMKADGSSPVRITDSPGYDGGPFFSPDGRRLVYRSDRKSNDLLQVFTAELAFDDQGNVAGRKSEKQLTDDQNVNWGPFWHPQGKHLVYATSVHGHQNYELYLMRDDGSAKTRITYKDGADVLPVFSPDGKWLMWTSKRTADGTTQVFAARFKMPGGE